MMVWTGDRDVALIPKRRLGIVLLFRPVKCEESFSQDHEHRTRDLTGQVGGRHTHE